MSWNEFFTFSLWFCTHKLKIKRKIGKCQESICCVDIRCQFLSSSLRIINAERRRRPLIVSRSDDDFSHSTNFHLNLLDTFLSQFLMFFSLCVACEWQRQQPKMIRGEVRRKSRRKIDSAAVGMRWKRLKFISYAFQVYSSSSNKVDDYHAHLFHHSTLAFHSILWRRGEILKKFQNSFVRKLRNLNERRRSES